MARATSSRGQLNQATSANRLVAPTKNAYYKTNIGTLIYVVSIMPDKDFVLVENCKTNKTTWIRMADFHAYDVVKIKAV